MVALNTVGSPNRTPSTGRPSSDAMLCVTPQPPRSSKLVGGEYFDFGNTNQQARSRRRSRRRFGAPMCLHLRGDAPGSMPQIPRRRIVRVQCKRHHTAASVVIRPSLASGARSPAPALWRGFRIELRRLVRARTSNDVGVSFAKVMEKQPARSHLKRGRATNLLLALKGVRQRRGSDGGLQDVRHPTAGEGRH